jgi:hypothetical protein
MPAAIVSWIGALVETSLYPLLCNPEPLVSIVKVAVSLYKDTFIL